MSNLSSLFRSYGTGLAKAALRGSWIVPVAVFINDTFLEVNPVEGQSMSPTLSPNLGETGACDHLVVWKPGAAQDVRRGEIVAFWSASNPENLSIKRVIATAGDTVYPREGRFTEMMVPYGHIWVEGDNWRKTKDSSDYGPISKSLILGKATHILWPWRRIGALSTEWHHPRTRVVPGTAEIPAEFVD